MPSTARGIYYADNATSLSVAGISQAMAESVDTAIGIAQIVYGKTSSIVDNTSPYSFVKSGLSATITPKYIDSEIFVLVHLPYKVTSDRSSAGEIISADFNLDRNSTTISETATGIANATYSGISHSLSLSYPDSPGTLSAVEYSVSGKVSSFMTPKTTPLLKMNYSEAVSTSTIVLIEVIK